MLQDLWWFLGILLGLFIIWVMLGGPERARKENISPIINGPVGQSNSQNDTPSSASEINVIRVD